MKIKNNQQAPEFWINDVYGNPVSLEQYKGQKVHLAFYRFSGCPFCYLRFRQVNELADIYKKNNVRLISVYESSPENMRAMIAGEQFYSIMIPNPDSSLYRLYDLDKSWLGFFRFLLFGGGISRVMKGNKMFKNKVAMDGHSNRIEAEFLINESGKVINAHYGKAPGDNLSLDTIRRFLNYRVSIEPRDN